MALIELIDGRKTFRDGDRESVIFDRVQLRVDQGEFVSITGRSGSGKSTLLHILGGMDRLTSGTYRFKGMPVSEMKEGELARFRGRRFGFVFQSFHLIDEFTALQNVETPMGYAGVPRKARRERALELLRRVGLADKAGHYPAQLSGGQQQRVAIARALANEPEVIFADEPTGSLDRGNGEMIEELLLELNRQGTTLVLVTHDERLASRARRIYVLEDGRLLAK
jgi:ABC-type antimicrobial peptide transport system, ATPase component